MLHGGWVHLHEKDSLLEEGVPVTRQGMKKYSVYPDHQGALGLVVCPQPMQHSLPCGLLEEGGGASLPGHQAGEEEVLTQQGAATTHAGHPGAHLAVFLSNYA